MTEMRISKLAFGSFAQFCFLISAHVAAILGLLFAVTNGGRRVSFGSYHFFGGKADLVGLLFLFLSLSLLFGLLSTLSYPSVNMLLKLTRGLRVKGTVKIPPEVL